MPMVRTSYAYSGNLEAFSPRLRCWLSILFDGAPRVEMTSFVNKRQKRHRSSLFHVEVVEATMATSGISITVLVGLTFIVSAQAFSSPSQHQPVGNVLILDHLNINHEQGRHDWLKAFYFDFLHCAVDPRKEENLHSGKKTLWANIGSNQFHLPEGKPDAQVLEGVVTLAYPDLAPLKHRYESVKTKLEDSQFHVEETKESSLRVTDPWGTEFLLVKGESTERDPRGCQPGEVSEGMALRDMTVYTPPGCDLAGVGRFYEIILGAPVLSSSDDSVVVSVGPQQTLTFCPHPQGKTSVAHEDLRDAGESPEGMPLFLSNYGPHISMYVNDLVSTYERANKLGLCYVNPRFKRRAYTKDAAIDDCMFRCINIVDPEDDERKPIIKLEHEIRSVIKRDGTKYRSCPFDDIPATCKTPTQEQLKDP